MHHFCLPVCLWHPCVRHFSCCPVSPWTYLAQVEVWAQKASQAWNWISQLTKGQRGWMTGSGARPHINMQTAHMYTEAKNARTHTHAHTDTLPLWQTNSTCGYKSFLHETEISVWNVHLRENSLGGRGNMSIKAPKPSLGERGLVIQFNA